MATQNKKSTPITRTILRTIGFVEKVVNDISSSNYTIVDLEKGYRKQGDHCPIANTISKAMPSNKVHVSKNRIYIKFANKTSMISAYKNLTDHKINVVMRVNHDPITRTCFSDTKKECNILEFKVPKYIKEFVERFDGQSENYACYQI